MEAEVEAQGLKQKCVPGKCWEEQPLVPPTLEYRPVTVNQVWTGMAAVFAILIMVWFTTTHQ